MCHQLESRLTITVYYSMCSSFSFSSSRSTTLFFFFFFNATAPTQIYTLSLHVALPISEHPRPGERRFRQLQRSIFAAAGFLLPRSEEHTSELQSRFDLVCRLLLEKKKIY